MPTCCYFPKGTQSPLTYHLNHTEPWLVQRRQRSSHLEQPPEEDTQEAEVENQSSRKRDSSPVFLPREDRHEESPQLGLLTLPRL